MTYSRLSIKKYAYYVKFIILTAVVFGCITPSAMAQSLAPPPVAPQPVTGNAFSQSDDPNPKTVFDTREDYFKRMPFARNAFDHDDKTVYPWTTREVEGPPEASWFSSIGDFFGGIADTVGGWLGFGNGDSQGSTDAETRSQYSEPLEGAAGPVHVTAYPFFIKFCNDNPYQGVCYWQMGEAFDRPRTERDEELFENVLTTFGYPVSDTQFQLIQRENFQRLLELLYDPERYAWMATNTSQMQAASAANSLAGVSESAFEQMVTYILDGHNGNGGLLNVANEASASAMNLNALYRPVSAAYDVVMRCYKELYTPMAILFLLPGAVITQAKATVSKGFDLGEGNPFEGIIRSMVAVFLIPGTQVIVSYSIDVGNSMATSAEDWVDRGLIIEWQHELTYNVNPHENHKNVIEPPEAQVGEVPPVVFEGQNGESGQDNIVNSDQYQTTGSGGGGGGGGGLSGALGSLGGAIGGVIGSILNGLSWLAGFFEEAVFGSGGEGLGANIPEVNTTQEEQLALSQTMQFLFNGASFLGALTIIILTAMQVVLICYLFLLGPLSAAFFAWPDIGGSQSLFRKVFGNWLQAVIIVSLWRFYWVVGLVLMTQRLLFINNGHYGTGDLQWEVAIFVCILGLMIWASMNPFTYDPAKAYEFVQDFVEKSTEAGKNLSAASGGGGGGGGGQGGQGGDGGGGGSDNGTDSPASPTDGGGGGGTDGDVQLDGSADNAVAVSDSGSQSAAGEGGGDGGGSGSADPTADSGSGVDLSGQSPEGIEAPPTESGGAGTSMDAAAGDGPPTAEAAAGMALAAMAGGGGSQVNSDAAAIVAAAGAKPEAMPEGQAPVEKEPGDGSSTRGLIHPDASGGDTQLAMGGGVDTGGAEGGQMQVEVQGDADGGAEDGGSSESKPINMADIQPPPNDTDQA